MGLTYSHLSGSWKVIRFNTVWCAPSPGKFAKPARQIKTLQKAIYIYFIKSKLLTEQIAQVKDPERCNLWTDTIKNSLFLFRGFFAGGIFGFVLG
ncbi:hypothetical protein PoMZ_09181 [Pyricularia oryzae]|uniref:Uncharacterized protein n=1 Tax=Pyricularia oryzae TaxID=318829 RepID=A0A4P7MTG7_PYROR|nr:hypothetical protein PoMZ_09181 [Pyricularia oryzae]